MSRKLKPNAERDALFEAVRRVQDRLNPQTLGPCSYCEWPITQIVSGDYEGKQELHCALCDRFTDTLFCRDFWNEYPANAI